MTFCVRWRYATVAIGIAVLLLTVGVWKGGWIRFTFFPKVEGDTLTCSVTMPAGTSVHRTEQVVKRLEEAARQTLQEAEKKRPQGSEPLLEYMIALVGMQTGGHGPNRGSGQTGSHLAQVFVQLLEGEKRDVSAMALVKAWRKKVGAVPDAESVSFESDLFNAGNPIEVHLSHNDHDRLLEAADDLKDELRKYPGVFDVSDSFLREKTKCSSSSNRPREVWD